MKILGAFLCCLTAAFVVSLLAVPIQAWPEWAPASAYLRPVIAFVPCLILTTAAAAVLAQPRGLIGAPGRALAVAAVLAAFLWPAYAYAQDAAATTVNVGDTIRDFRDAILWAVGGVVTLVVTLAAEAIRRSTGLSINTQMQERVKNAAMIGVRLGLDKAEHMTSATTIEVKSKVLQVAIEHIRANAAREVKKLNMGPQDVDALARASLQEAVAQPAINIAAGALTGLGQVGTIFDRLRDLTGGEPGAKRG